MWFLILPAFSATVRVGTDAPTLADAIGIAASGDTLLIPAGIWAGCVDTAGKSLQIFGETGAEVQATGCDSAIRVVSGETVHLEGLKVSNGEGRAFEFRYSTLSLKNVQVENSGNTTLPGGAIWIFGGTLTTENCTFRANQAMEGGAIYLHAYTIWTDSGSEFFQNSASGSGGAVMAYYANAVSLSGSIFSLNRSESYGGAIASWDYSNLSVTGARFVENAAIGTGGGAIFYFPVDGTAGRLSVSDSSFSKNLAVDGAGIWTGWAADTQVSNCQFRENQAESGGGGLYAYTAGSLTLDHNHFCANTAKIGGGASVINSSFDSWSYNVFLRNEATNGGGLWRSGDANGVILHNSFAANRASDAGAAYASSAASVVFTDNLIAETQQGSGLFAEDEQSGAKSAMAYNGWANNVDGNVSGYFRADEGVNGNVMSEDPGFVSWSANGDCDSDDVRLLATSPFKNVGDPNLLDIDGSRADLGAYGGPGQLVVDADLDGFDTTTDCDDTSAEHSPDALEQCNQIDDNCDGQIDEAGAIGGQLRYPDGDGDGFGDQQGGLMQCAENLGWVENAEDCDDLDPWVNPDAPDLPNDGIDGDCDGADRIVDPHIQDPDTEKDGLCGGQGAWLLLGAAFGYRRQRATR